MDVEQRIRRLERRNTTLQIAVAALAGLLLLAPLLGAARSQESPDILRASELWIADEGGNTLRLHPLGIDMIVRLANGRTHTGLLLSPTGMRLESPGELGGFGVDVLGNVRSWGPDGEVRIRRGLGVSVVDGTGTGRAWLHAEAGFQYMDANETLRVAIDSDGLAYFDEDENNRADLGRLTLISSATGAETMYPTGLALYDVEGSVIWQAPR